MTTPKSGTPSNFTKKPKWERRGGMFAKSLSSCVDTVTQPALKQNGLAGSRILTHWASIVGPSLSLNAVPVKLAFTRGKKTDGVLTICIRPGFAPQLQHQQPMILERIAQYFGYQAVSRIMILHQWPKDSDAVVKRAIKRPISKEAAAQVAQVSNPELRAALTALADAIAASQKA